MTNVLGHRVRGFRVVNVVALLLAMLMALGVYWAKTSAGRERAAIDEVQRQIVTEERRTRLLQAEIAYLERPDRIGSLASNHLAMAPIRPDREANADALAQIATSPAPAPHPPVAGAPH